MDNVSAFYEEYPYPPPADDVEAYRRSWNDARRRAEAHLFWPAQPFRDKRSLLVAGCGTMQAAHYATRWPEADVVGIDVSANSIAFARDLKRKHALNNLTLQVLPVEQVQELGRSFDFIVCTGVLHHLKDPVAGLQAMQTVLNPGGAMHVMVYAPYGRTGVYMLQEYCRRLGIGRTETEIRDLARTLRALPTDHPLTSLLRNAPDFATAAGLADALLHPRDRSYTVSQFFEFLGAAGLRFGRWIRQAPYLAACGAVAATPHRVRLEALAPEAQYAALELFRGTMTRHSAVAYNDGDPNTAPAPDFSGSAWRNYVPLRLPETAIVRENLPAGAAAVLLNRAHTYTDLYLPLTVPELRLIEAADGERTIAEISGSGELETAGAFFEKLWKWDQVVFDASSAR